MSHTITSTATYLCTQHAPVETYSGTSLLWPGFHPEGIIGGGGGGGGGGGAPGSGCGFIYFFIQLSQIWGGGGREGEASPPPPPPPLDETLMALRTKDTSIIQTAIDGPKRSAIETCTYLTSELRTPLYSVLRMHDPAPKGHIAQLTNSIIWSGPHP